MRRRERESLWRAKNGMTEKWRQEIEGETEKFKKQNKTKKNKECERGEPICCNAEQTTAIINDGAADEYCW